MQLAQKAPEPARLALAVVAEVERDQRQAEVAEVERDQRQAVVGVAVPPIPVEQVAVEAPGVRLVH